MPTQEALRARYRATGRELKEILGPMPVRRFMARYWGRRPLVIRGGARRLESLLQGGFDRRDLERALDDSGAQELEAFDGLGRCAETDDGDGSISPNEVQAKLARGMNVVAEKLDDTRIAAFAAQLKTQVGHPGEVALFATLSPAGNGFPLHVDSSDAFFIQCEGRKRFRFSKERLVEAPRGTILFDDEGEVTSCQFDAEDHELELRVDVSQLREVVLEPGDILYSPAGVVHGTEASNGPTLNLNLLFYPASFSDLIGRLLSELSELSPKWRSGPAAPTTSALPSDVKRYIRERLDELSTWVDDARDADALWERAWRKAVADPGEAIRKSLAVDATPLHRVRKSERLRVTRRLPPVASASKSELHVFYGDRELHVSGEWVPFMRTLLAKKTFVAEAATTWSDTSRAHPWSTTREYLEALLHEGVLERCA